MVFIFINMPVPNLLELFFENDHVMCYNYNYCSRFNDSLHVYKFSGLFLKPASMSTKGGNPVVAVLITWILVQVSIH